MRFLTPLVATILLFELLSASHAQEPADAPPAAWKTEIKGCAIPMRDGKTLAADIYLPKNPGQYPTVLIQTPYNKDRMGAVTPDSGEAGRGSQNTYSQFDFDNFAYVIVDWRGFYASKSAMQGVNKRQWKRGQDGFDTVEWIAKQSWSNGKVGTWGGSALGKQQLDTAAEQPPHLVCCVPLIASMGQSYEAYYQGGVKLEAHVERLDQLGYGVSTVVNDNPLPDTLTWRLARKLTYAPEKINVPCLMVSGWWDNYPDQVVETFNDICAKGGEAARKHSKLVMGPWSHTAIDIAKQGDLEFKNAANYSTKLTLKFLDFWLRDQKDNGFDNAARVHYYLCGEEAWHEAPQWSAIKTQPRCFYLHAQGTINEVQPAKQMPPATDGSSAPEVLTRAFRYDSKNPLPTRGGANLPPLTHGPKDNAASEKRSDLLVYSTGKLEKPVTLVGNTELEFTFSVDRVDCDFHVHLCDSDGKASYLVAEGIQRAKLVSGAVKLLTPGEKTRIKVKLNLAAYTFVAGHELKIMLSCGNWPRYERNCCTGDDHWDEKKAMEVNVTLYHDAEAPVILRLPAPVSK